MSHAGKPSSNHYLTNSFLQIIQKNIFTSFDNRVQQNFKELRKIIANAARLHLNSYVLVPW